MKIATYSNVRTATAADVLEARFSEDVRDRLARGVGFGRAKRGATDASEAERGLGGYLGGP